MSHKSFQWVGSQVGRRGFLGKLGAAAFAGSAALAIPGLTSNAEARAASGCCTNCSYETSRTVACCHLGFNKTCANGSCFNGSHTWWAWTCCCNGLLTDCYECCDFRCSYIQQYAGCGCPPRGCSGAAIGVGNNASKVLC